MSMTPFWSLSHSLTYYNKVSKYRNGYIIVSSASYNRVIDLAPSVATPLLYLGVLLQPNLNGTMDTSSCIWKEWLLEVSKIFC